jgi:hypothetical protein
MLRYISIFLVLIPSLVRAADDSDAAKYFEDYLANCGTNEIRCIWFLDDRPNVGMVMTLSLLDHKVYTAREVYNWATQNSGTHKLTHPQVVSLQKIVGQLPASDEKVEFKRAVSVSIRRGGKVEVFHYDRQHAPAVIQRLYDIGGGDCYDGT